MPVRRVVTGHNGRGKSCVLIDEPFVPGQDRYVWTTDETPANNSGTLDAARMPARLEPAQNGSAFRVVRFPPESALAGLSASEKEEFYRKLFANMNTTHCRVDTERPPGMHKTSTTDYIVVLRGKVTLILDEDEVTVEAGDLIVQRGTNHDWVVRGAEPAILGVVMLTAHPA